MQGISNGGTHSLPHKSFLSIASLWSKSPVLSKECLWSEREAEEDVECRTISEVVNPLYIRATQVTQNR